ncbi:MAG: hypothetical protein RL398_2573, partial [Planctomycetota bacterium]
MRRRSGLSITAVLLALAVGAAWAWSGRDDGLVPFAAGEQDAAATAARDVPGGDSQTTRTVVDGGDAGAEASSSLRSMAQDGTPLDAVADGIAFEVVDAEQQPVVGAPIAVSWYRPDRDEHLQGCDLGQTDADGRFRSSVHKAEELEGVQVTLPWLGATATVHDLQPARTGPDTIVLVAPTVAELDVLVVGAEERPIAAAKVFVEHAATLDEPLRYCLQAGRLQAVTDAEGRARMRVPAARCRVWVQAPEHESDCEWHCRFVPGRNTLRLDPEPTSSWRTVRIEVVRPADCRAKLSLAMESSERQPRAPQAAVLDVVGERRWFYGTGIDAKTTEVSVPPLAWHLRIETEGCEPWRRWIAPEERVVRAELVALSAAARHELRGIVRRHDGQPCADAHLYWYTAEEAKGRMVGASDAEGRFVLWVPAEPVGWLSAWRDAAAPAWAGPFSPPGRRHELELRLQPPATIEATLVDERGAGLDATMALATSPMPEAVLDQRGIYTGDWATFDRVPAGDRELWGYPDRGGWPARRIVRAGERVALVSGEGLDAWVRIAATVVDAQSLRALGAASCGDRTADADGRLGLVFAPGTHRITLAADGYASRCFVLSELAPGLQSRQFALPRAATRFLRFLDAAGRPLADCEVSVLDEAGGADARWPITADSDAEGRCELLGAPIGRLQLVVRHYERDNG